VHLSRSTTAVCGVADEVNCLGGEGFCDLVEEVAAEVGFTATTEEMVVASVAPGGPTSLSRSGSERPTERRTAESTTSCGRRSSMWGSSSARRRASSGSALSRAFCFGPSSGWHPATSACPCWVWRRRSLEGVEFDEIEQVLVRVPHLCRSTRKAGRPPPWRSRCCADRPVWVAVRFRCSDLWIGRGGRRARAGGHLGFRTAPRRVRCPRRHRRSWRSRRWPPRRAERRALRARPASCPSAARR
jgi:hypothetical protein